MLTKHKSLVNRNKPSENVTKYNMGCSFHIKNFQIKQRILQPVITLTCHSSFYSTFPNSRQAFQSYLLHRLCEDKYNISKTIELYYKNIHISQLFVEFLLRINFL